jgi:hypothetical protein
MKCWENCKHSRKDFGAPTCAINIWSGEGAGERIRAWMSTLNTGRDEAMPCGKKFGGAENCPGYERSEE